MQDDKDENYSHHNLCQCEVYVMVIGSIQPPRFENYLYV